MIWNQFLQITKVIEFNDICKKNNNLSKNPFKRESDIKEELFNQIIPKKTDKKETNSNNRNNNKTEEKSKYMPGIVLDELIVLLYTGIYDNLIYPKRNNEKNFKFNNNPNEISSNTLTQNSSENITTIKKEITYVSVNYEKSSNIYNEIFDYLLSIKRNNVNIQKFQSKYPKMNYNQVLSYFPNIYPERINTKSYNHTKKRV